MKAVCKNPKNYNLSLEKSYEVISTLNDFYVIQNDKGLVRSYNKALFAEPVVVEEQPAPPPKTFDELQFSVDVIGNDEVQISLYGDEETDIDFGFNTGDVAGNCGVTEYEGINEAYEEIYNSTREFLLEQNIDFNEHELKELVGKMLKASVLQLVERAHHDNKAMIVFSTNDEFPEIWTVLDEVSDLSTPSKLNPGSGAQIKVWILYTS